MNSCGSMLQHGLQISYGVQDNLDQTSWETNWETGGGARRQFVFGQCASQVERQGREKFNPRSQNFRDSGRDKRETRWPRCDYCNVKCLHVVTFACLHADMFACRHVYVLCHVTCRYVDLLICWRGSKMYPATFPTAYPVKKLLYNVMTFVRRIV